MNIEKLLDLAADSCKMPGWKDSLSMILDKEASSIKALDDDLLSQVAGGSQVEPDPEDLKKRLEGIFD